jgi:hypothetical protein
MKINIGSREFFGKISAIHRDASKANIIQCSDEISIFFS